MPVELRDKIRRMVGYDIGRAGSPSTQMAHALALKEGHTYEGTVPAAEKARRRAKNKRARAARRLNR